MGHYDSAGIRVYGDYSGKGYGCAPAYKSHPHDVRLIATPELLSHP
jgi:hypothetical protein